MTIKKKDGNVYVLEGPNKLTKNQEKIDLSKCLFHNFIWQEIVYGSTKTFQKAPVQIVQEKKIIEKDLEKFDSEDFVFEEEKKDNNELEVENKKFPILKVKVLMHCLPVVMKNHKDNFYGENWQTISYGKKFIMPSVIISNNDLQLEFWTSDPENKILEKSIVYPFSYEVYNENTSSYDRVPFDEYRWWKIVNKETKETGGYLFTAVPSEDHPDFSD